MLLKCRGLSFSYPDSSIKVIDRLSFTMEEPGFNAVFGPSGAGKTSFARILAGRTAFSEGDIRTERINKILYSYNLERLPGWSSIGKHLNAITPPDKMALQEELTDIFELRDFMKARFSQLSLGQQNRINLIRYLVQEFDLLILDESLANVDEMLRQRIILQIKHIFPDRMFLYISHNLMEVAKFCKDILVLGASAKEQGCRIISGQDYQQDHMSNKNELDAAMLEIMNVS